MAKPRAEAKAKGGGDKKDMKDKGKVPAPAPSAQPDGLFHRRCVESKGIRGCTRRHGRATFLLTRTKSRTRTRQTTLGKCSD